MMQKIISDFLLKTLSPNDYKFSCDVPGSTEQLKFGPVEDLGDGKGEQPIYIAVTYPNDGFELWLGTMKQWHVFYEAKEARKLAWFILWTWWARGTWFGLKRKLFYWALHNNVQRMLAKNGKL